MLPEELTVHPGKRTKPAREMKHQECDRAPALPLVVWGPRRRGSGRAQSCLGTSVPGGFNSNLCSETDPKPRGCCGKCPTSIRSLGWDTGIGVQPSHFTTSTQDSLSKRRWVTTIPSVFENSPWSHLAEWGLSDPRGGWDIPGLSWKPGSCPCLHTSPMAFLCSPLPLLTPELTGAFPSPSLGRTNGLIQGHPARSVSLRQSCAQLCVKNGLRLPSEQAGLVGANCWGFVNACQLPQRQWTGGPSPLKCQAAWLGALSRPGQTSSCTPVPAPSSELSRAEMWGRDLPSFLLLWPLHSRSGPALERALNFITRPLGTNFRSALFNGQNLFIHLPPADSLLLRGHWSP